MTRMCKKLLAHITQTYKEMANNIELQLILSRMTEVVSL